MNLLHRWRATWNPDMYHGWGRTRKYFEGWYFKAVNKDESAAWAFIPGISMDRNGNRHAFIQVMDGIGCSAHYHRFSADLFVPSPDGFEISLGENQFSGRQIRLALPGLKGELHFEATQPWPKMLGAPGIMGWYSFVPFMECFHGVVSLHHQLRGALEIDGLPLDFTGGRGYIEKDWGRSFPRAYVWLQTNHFDTSDRASLMASVAHIPWLGSYFIGFIAGFWLDGRLFRFATYTGAKKRLEIGEHSVSLMLKNPKTELHIQASQAPGTALHLPIAGEMTGKINESMQATISAELRENGHTIFSGTARTSGLEVAGEIGLLT